MSDEAKDRRETPYCNLWSSHCQKEFGDIKAILQGKPGEENKGIIVRLNLTAKDIEGHIKDGDFWRGVVVTACVFGLAHLMAFCILWGSLTTRVDRLERIHDSNKTGDVQHGVGA